MIGVALLSLLVAFSGAVVPGPLFVVALQQAQVFGWMSGVWLIVGHMLAEVLLLVAIFAGLGGVLQRKVVMRTVGIVGGLVMLYFAWGMIELALHGPLGHGQQGHFTAMSTGMLIGQGFVLSVFNPYWVLWWATIGVGMISNLVAKHGKRAWIAFFIGHESADYIWYVGISLLIALSGAFLSESVHRVLILVCGVGIAVLGLLFIIRPLIDWRASLGARPSWPSQ